MRPMAVRVQAVMVPADDVLRWLKRIVVLVVLIGLFVRPKWLNWRAVWCRWTRNTQLRRRERVGSSDRGGENLSTWAGNLIGMLGRGGKPWGPLARVRIRGELFVISAILGGIEGNKWWERCRPFAPGVDIAKE